MIKQVKKIPGFGRWLLKKMTKPGDYDFALGDISEIFIKLAEEKNNFRARCWFWFHVISAIPRFFKNRICWSTVMFKNYLKIAFRNIKRHKIYSIINVAGLSIGMSCCILALLWVQDELSFDRFFKNSDNIFRIIAEEQTSNQVIHNPRSPNALITPLKNDYPEIINATRYSTGYSGWWLNYEGNYFDTEIISYSDPNIFELFSFPFLKGDPKTVIENPNSIVMTEEIALKYFGEDEPIGKIIHSSGGDDFKVTGVLKNIPDNSHIKFDVMLRTDITDFELHSWEQSYLYTYIQLRENASVEEVNRKIGGIVKLHHPESSVNRLYLQPLKKIHLFSSHMHNNRLFSGRGNITYVYVFSLIALGILCIACINFMNLTTARASVRAKEIGMRKVTGARRRDIVYQFLGESILFSVIALIFALILAFLFLPVFNNYSNKQLTMDFPGSIPLLFRLIGITLFTGIIAGSYPAFYLSRFNPVHVLKKSFLNRVNNRLSLRKILVVTQFIFTIILLIGTTVIYNQLSFIKNRPLGFDKDHLIFFPKRGYYQTNFEAAKNELLQNPNILSVSSGVPPVGITPGTKEAEWEGKNPEDMVTLHPETVDYDYLKTYNMQMAEGRFFSKEFMSDTSHFILNETAVKAMGIESPVGKWLSFTDPRNSELRRGIIIGVIKDFHHNSLFNDIEPLVLVYRDHCFFLNVRIHPENVSQTIDFLKSKWEKFVPGFAFGVDFLDEEIDNFYKTEVKINSVVKYFTFLAILISCLGLFGLASFIAERRTKEIGVRKVLGASIPGMIILLSKEFTKWVLIANIFAWPISYFAMTRWLQSFAYRINLGLGIFILSALLSLGIALVTVSYQAMRAATANPVEALRFE